MVRPKKYETEEARLLAIRFSKRIWAMKHREKLRATSKAYYQQHKERLIALNKLNREKRLKNK